MSREDIEVKRLALSVLKNMKDSKDFERFNTPIKGVFISSIWDKKTGRKKFLVEINPVDKYDNPTKRKGYYLRSVEALKTFLNVIFEDEVLLRRILNAVQLINEEQTTG